MNYRVQIYHTIYMMELQAYPWRLCDLIKNSLKLLSKRMVPKKPECYCFLCNILT